jgi:hypothetical protein
LVGSTPMKRW